MDSSQASRSTVDSSSGPSRDPSSTRRSPLGQTSGNSQTQDDQNVILSDDDPPPSANNKRKRAARTPGVKYSQPASVTAGMKQMFDALDKYARFRYSCSLSNECYHECIEHIFGTELTDTEPLYLAAKNKLLKEFKTWKNTMLAVVTEQVQALVDEDDLPTTIFPIRQCHDHQRLQMFFTNHYQVYNAAAVFDHAKDVILWEESSSYAQNFFLKGIYLTLAVNTKLWLDYESDRLNPETVLFNREYLLDIFDSMTKKTELSQLTPGQLMPKRPKLADRRAKRRKAIADPNTNSHIIIPTGLLPPVPKDVSTAFAVQHWKGLVTKKTQVDEDDGGSENELPA